MDIIVVLKIINNIYVKKLYRIISFKNHGNPFKNLTSLVQKFDTLSHETFNILCQSDNCVIKVLFRIYILHRK